MSEQQHSEQPPVKKPEEKDHHYGDYKVGRDVEEELREIHRRDQDKVIGGVKKGKIPKGTIIA